MSNSTKALKAQLVNEIAKKYKRQIETLKERNNELEALCAKYRKEIAKLQKSLELQRNKDK